jgi:hypothetical protein
VAQGAPPVSLRWKIEKSFNQKNFHNFVWTPVGSRVNIYLNFAFKLTLRCLQPDIVPIIFHRCSVNDTGGKFAAGFVDTSCTLTCECLREFSKIFEMTLLLFSGAWGKVIHEKI